MIVCKDCFTRFDGDTVPSHGCALFAAARHDRLSDEDLVLLEIGGEHCAEVVEAIPALKRAVVRLVRELRAERLLRKATPNRSEDK